MIQICILTCFLDIYCLFYVELVDVVCVCQYVNWFHVIETTDFIGMSKNNINRTTKIVTSNLPQCIAASLIFLHLSHCINYGHILMLKIAIYLLSVSTKYGNQRISKSIPI